MSSPALASVRVETLVYPPAARRRASDLFAL